nr:helix-turn-helix transcriptional regulator [uncultured Oscillibacter sp.]
MNFAEHLLQLRTEKKLTQPETAAAVGMSLRGYQNYERGLREPKMAFLIALADFYGISLDELVCRDWPREPEA